MTIFINTSGITARHLYFLDDGAILARISAAQGEVLVRRPGADGAGLVAGTGVAGFCAGGGIVPAGCPGGRGPDAGRPGPDPVRLLAVTRTGLRHVRHLARPSTCTGSAW